MAERSFHETEQLVRAAIKAAVKPGTKYVYIYIRDMFPSTVVYQEEGSDWESRLLSQRSYVIDANGTVTLGEATQVIEQKTYAPLVKLPAFAVVFSAADGTDGGSTGAAASASGGTDTEAGYIEKEGLLFKAGNYPDKNYKMTPEEVQDAISKFTPVELELEHYDTVGASNILSGKFGSVAALYSPDGGQSLYAKYKLATWVKQAVGDAPIKTSAVWNPDTKTLARVGLVVQPRITDAAMMSAYATFAGKRHSRADLGDLQAIHDLVVKQGATCVQASAFTGQPPERSGTYTHTNEQERTREHPQQEGRRMGLRDDIKRLFGQASKEELVEYVEGTPPPAAVLLHSDGAGSGTGTGGGAARTEAQPDPRVAQMEAQPDPRVAQMEAQLAAFAQRERERDARDWFEAELRAGRVLPAERAGLIAMFTRTAEDDLLHPAQISFSASDGTTVQGSRLDALKASIAARKPHSLFGEHIGTGPVVTLSQNSGGTGTGTGSTEPQDIAERKQSATKYAEQMNGAGNGRGAAAGTGSGTGAGTAGRNGTH